MKGRLAWRERGNNAHLSGTASMVNYPCGCVVLATIDRIAKPCGEHRQQCIDGLSAKAAMKQRSLSAPEAAK